MCTNIYLSKIDITFVLWKYIFWYFVYISTAWINYINSASCTHHFELNHLIETCGCSDISDVDMNILRGIMTDQILTEHNHTVRKEKYFQWALYIDSFGKV